MNRTTVAAINIMLVAIGSGCATPPTLAQPAEGRPRFDDTFWTHWGDGNAEVCGYALTMPRYEQMRRGQAVAIFVTETFSDSVRVKADGSRNGKKNDTFPAMKLNLIKDFQTGIYDYHTMCSAFINLRASKKRPAGSPSKVSFSAQEWCGHVYEQILFDASRIRHELHSYFGGEADNRDVLPFPRNGLSADTLLLWARGMCAPFLEPGENRSAAILRSLQDARLSHQSLAWQDAMLSRSLEPQKVSVPAGTFDADVYSVTVAGGLRWTIHVEADWPNRILRWERSDGEKGELLKSARLKYWELNQNGAETALENIGLTAP